MRVIRLHVSRIVITLVFITSIVRNTPVYAFQSAYERSGLEDVYVSDDDEISDYNYNQTREEEIDFSFRELIEESEEPNDIERYEDERVEEERLIEESAVLAETLELLQEEMAAAQAEEEKSEIVSTTVDEMKEEPREAPKPKIDKRTRQKRTKVKRQARAAQKDKVFKFCPKCKREFTDRRLVFCTFDGKNLKTKKKE